VFTLLAIFIFLSFSSSSSSSPSSSYLIGWQLLSGIAASHSFHCYITVSSCVSGDLLEVL
jgi:hypothetical protein